MKIQASPRKILVVDDEKDLVALLKRNLELEGYDVFTAHDGKTALEAVDTIAPDMILLDLTMPEESGISVYTKLCTEHARPRYPVIIMTAREDLRRTFQDVDADAFLAKPFEMDELLLKMRLIWEQIEAQVVFLLDLKSNPHCQGLMDCLKEERYQVVLIEDISKLEGALRKELPNYILMEYVQKELPGEEAVRRVKEVLSTALSDRAITTRVPVLVYSYSGFDYEVRSLKSGADGFVKDPAHYGNFVTALRAFELHER
ncbi:MAG: response regulator [Candidatus Omnitrophica bacterium]|nr:response regulator [Candidatus Omnitrophota bacterium]